MQNILLIVLTENNWLLEGLKSLLPEMACLRMNFNTRHIPHEVMSARRVIIAVDSLIFFRGEWLAFNNLQSCRGNISVIWLMLEYTGRVFPAASRGDRILSQAMDIESMGHGIREIPDLPKASKSTEYVRSVKLTLTERRLLPYFTTGVSLPVIARKLGCAVKTLYNHRQSILAKAGFRQPVFMEYLYQRNPGFSGIYSPELHLWKDIWQEQLEHGLSKD
ncbi:helix-turn-helix transcriptional regulator [Enterobacter bugandensis]|uniref:helix-turn-helix transcriptional regulator n=1 Tax=Enterobacter bugandensis TaxID=881260 RepID=UPI002002AA76|nr:transcriptional regulator [Enterobacter bugandensis]MCK6964526.1 transcriptional regulator [Enterobacter bugandensis]